MNFFTWSLFLIIVGYFLSPIICSVREMVRLKLLRKNYEKEHEVKLILVPFLASFIFGLFFIVLIFLSWLLIYEYPIFDYIVSVIGCLLAAVASMESIYFVPGETVDTYLKAFKKGYTEGISKSFLTVFPIKISIHIIYIFTLIASHIISLYFKDYPIYNSEFFRFLEVNKYGIVIMYAFEKIIDSIKKKDGQKQMEIMNETCDILDKQDKQSLEEYKASKEKARKVIKEYLKRRKEERKKCKK